VSSPQVAEGPARDRSPRPAGVPVVDGHNDLAWAMRRVAYDFDATDIAKPQPQLHTDLGRIRSGGLAAQFWSVYVPGTFTGPAAVRATLGQIDAVYAMIERYADDLVLVTNADGLDETVRERRHVGSLMGAEGGHCIDDSMAVLRTFYRLGVRYLTLTHNVNTAWADAATDQRAVGGLTRFGREVVAEMNRLGMLVDLSHVSAETMRDALDATEAPLIFSHSSARALVDHPRNVPDDVLSRLAVNGGVCMVTFVPYFVSTAARAWGLEVEAAAGEAGIDRRDLEAMDDFWDNYPVPQPRATLADVVAHVEHVREVAGIEHVGLGGDFDGMSAVPLGLDDVSCYPALLDALADRGWSSADLDALGHRNISRVLHDAEGVAERLRGQRGPSLATLEKLDGPAAGERSDSPVDQQPDGPSSGEEEPAGPDPGGP
jgi:membrane dipeptidase